MNYKLIILEKSYLALIYSKTKLLSIIMEHSIYHINDIYLGKLSTKMPSINAAFIILNSSAKNGFIHFDQLKKENQLFHNKDNKNILVQIIREPSGNKGPTVTTSITLTGKYIALFPFSKGIHIAKQFSNNKEKGYLYAIGYLLQPSNMAILIKVGATNANIDFLLKETLLLKTKWLKLIYRSNKILSPSLVSRKKPFLNTIFENYHKIPFNFIAIDSYEGCLKLRKIISKIYPTKCINGIRLEYHKDSSILIKQYLIDIIISEIMKPRVNLYKGGYIVIEKTEALTTIDVNSGSFTILSNSRETGLCINYAAVHEVVHQIKLRNIGGIIIIDFIDSNNQLDQMKILRYMSKLIKQDHVKCNIIQMSELGLVELTRARQGQSIYDAFSRKCRICNGLGYLSLNLTGKKITPYELLVNLTPILRKR
jgi:ribonuclease E